MSSGVVAPSVASPSSDVDKENRRIQVQPRAVPVTVEEVDQTPNKSSNTTLITDFTQNDERSMGGLSSPPRPLFQEEDARRAPVIPTAAAVRPISQSATQPHNDHSLQSSYPPLPPHHHQPPSGVSRLPSFFAPSPPESWRIDPSEVVRLPGPPLGTGAYGTVWRGSWHGMVVAVKELDSSIHDPIAYEEFRSEMDVWTRLKFPGVVQLYGAFTNPALCLVMQHCPHGALSDHLHGDPNITFSFGQLLRLASQVAGAVTYMHGRGIVHRDLKSFNVLIDEEGNARLSDFGLSIVSREKQAALSRAVSKSGLIVGSVGNTPLGSPIRSSPHASPLRTTRNANMASPQGSPQRQTRHAAAPAPMAPPSPFSPHQVNVTPRKPTKSPFPPTPTVHDSVSHARTLVFDSSPQDPYDHPGVGLPGTTLGPLGTYTFMSPELFRFGTYSFASDAYAFGQFMWELVARSVPFGATPPLEIASKVVHGYRPYLPKYLPRKWRSLIKACWEQEPKDRPSFVQIRTALAEMARDLAEEEEFAEQHRQLHAGSGGGVGRIEGEWTRAGRINDQQARRSRSIFDRPPCIPLTDEEEYGADGDGDEDDEDEIDYEDDLEDDEQEEDGPYEDEDGNDDRQHPNSFQLTPADLATLTQSERAYYHAQLEIDRRERLQAKQLAAANRNDDVVDVRSGVRLDTNLTPIERFELASNDALDSGMSGDSSSDVHPRRRQQERQTADDDEEAYWARVRAIEHRRAMEEIEKRKRESEVTKAVAQVNTPPPLLTPIVLPTTQRSNPHHSAAVADISTAVVAVAAATGVGSSDLSATTPPKFQTMRDVEQQHEEEEKKTEKKTNKRSNSKSQRNKKLLAKIAKMLEDDEDEDDDDVDDDAESVDGSYACKKKSACTPPPPPSAPIDDLRRPQLPISSNEHIGVANLAIASGHSIAPPESPHHRNHTPVLPFILSPPMAQRQDDDDDDDDAATHTPPMSIVTTLGSSTLPISQPVTIQTMTTPTVTIAWTDTQQTSTSPSSSSSIVTTQAQPSNTNRLIITPPKENGNIQTTTEIPSQNATKQVQPPSPSRHHAPPQPGELLLALTSGACAVVSKSHKQSLGPSRIPQQQQRGVNLLLSAPSTASAAPSTPSIGNAGAGQFHGSSSSSSPMINSSLIATPISVKTPQRFDEGKLSPGGSPLVRLDPSTCATPSQMNRSSQDDVAESISVPHQPSMAQIPILQSNRIGSADLTTFLRESDKDLPEEVNQSNRRHNNKSQSNDMQAILPNNNRDEQPNKSCCVVM